ncbi:FkbM family methyltransferase [uncultured Friedmanniella sp.]|uniref:FkbM family methyltransferase n=1 Tax=uncultured Friedmanniella sp. TaxID=335381 RepID=UPI0035CA9E8A
MATPSALRRLRSRAATLAARLDPRLVTPPAALWLSVRGRQRCSVRYDDGLWVRRYADGTLVDMRLGGPTPRQQDAYVTDVYLYGYLPQPGDTVVDVGAGVGSEARLFSRLVGPQGRVFCVEADPTAARCLRRTVAENDLRNVVVVEAALSSTRGSVQLELDPDRYISNRLAHEGRSGIAVRALTFADLMEEVGPGPVALLKMNIEGAEGEVLVPPPAELGRVEHVAVSCHDFKAGQPGSAWQATSTAVTAALRSSGYELESRPDDPRPWIRWYLYGARP